MFEVTRLTKMKRRGLAGKQIAPIGFGCMNVSHAYGEPPEEQASIRMLNEALDVGYEMFDTAALYGGGRNETLVGKAIGHRRHEFFLASKCGMTINDAGVREINGDPALLKRTCEASLRRLGTDVIDLYYLHRWDKRVPVEDSIGALADLVKEGKIKSIGLSEVSAKTLRKAHAVHPIAAVQTEYSLWTRNAEIAVLEACARLDVAFVAFSPVGRGLLAGGVSGREDLAEKDIRHAMPRFDPENLPKNLKLQSGLRSIAAKAGCTIAQLSLAWLLEQGDHVIPIPGTRSADHMRENLFAAKLDIAPKLMDEASAIVNDQTVSGARYNAATQTEIDTEEF